MQFVKFSSSKLFFKGMHIKFIRLKEHSMSAMDSEIRLENLIILSMSLWLSKIPALFHWQNTTLKSNFIFHLSLPLTDYPQLSLDLVLPGFHALLAWERQTLCRFCICFSHPLHLQIWEMFCQLPGTCVCRIWQGNWLHQYQMCQAGLDHLEYLRAINPFKWTGISNVNEISCIRLSKKDC